MNAKVNRKLTTILATDCVGFSVRERMNEVRTNKLFGLAHPRKVLNNGVARFAHVAVRYGYFENI